MTDIQPYPYPLAPEAHESLWGFSHRLATENLLDHHVWIRQDIGIQGNEAELDREQTKRLARMSRSTAQTLRRLQHGYRGMVDALLFGNRIRRRQLEFVRSRLCPLCYIANGHHNRIFDLRILRACPIHEIELVEACPKCGNQLSWHRNSVCACSKGHALWHERELAFEPRRINRRLDAERLIFERCGQPLTGPSPLEQLPPPVRELSLRSQLVLFSLLGDAASDFPENYRRGRQRRFDSVETWRMLNDGFESAQRLPESLTEWLSQRYDPSASGPSNLGKRIQPLQRELSDYKLTSEPAFKLLLAPLSRFARERGYFGKLTSGWMEEADPASDEITLQHAAKLMSVKLRRAKAIAKQEGWATFTPKQDAAATIVSRAKVQRWLKEGGDDLTCREAARLLGIRDAHVMDLANHRIIGSRRARDRTCKVTARDWHFKRYSITRLKARLREQLIEGNNGIAGVSFKEYRAMTRDAAVSYPNLVRAVLGGRIHPVFWPEGRGLDEIRFRITDLDRCLQVGRKRGPRKLKRNMVPASQKLFSLKALQIRFSTSMRTIEAAIEHGYLRAGRKDDGSLVVSAADLEKFEAELIFSGKAARDRGIQSVVELNHLLKNAGVLPVAAVTGSADGVLYRVAELEAKLTAVEQHGISRIN